MELHHYHAHQSLFKSGPLQQQIEIFIVFGID